MKRLYFMILLLSFSGSVRAQDSLVVRFVSLVFIKSKSADFLAQEKSLWVPVHNQLIKEHQKAAWYLYKVKYPTGTKALYDFVRFDVFSSWNQAESPNANLERTFAKLHPNLNSTGKITKPDQRSDVVWEQLFQIIFQAANKVDKPSRYIKINQVKTQPDSQAKYVELEKKYFKPFHAERIKEGLMHNWELLKAVAPYGQRHDYDYLTIDGFNAWEDITRGDAPWIWSKIHGTADFNKIHDAILKTRTTVNNEIWELVAQAVEQN